MMSDETLQISAKTRARTIDSIQKVGYSDGVVDGQNKSFQTSFDMGYEEGFKYGFKLGYNNAIIHKIDGHTSTVQETFKDSEVNCLICADNTKLNENVINLINLQKEKNNKI